MRRETVRSLYVLKAAAVCLGITALAALALLPSAAQASDPFPLRVVSDPNPNFSGIWVDTVNDEIAVGDDNNHGVIVYSRTANGPVLPLREIRGLASFLDYPSSVVVDVQNNELWAVNDDTSDRAVVYSRTASGNVVPMRVIDFGDLDIPEVRTWGWTVDTVHNEVIGSFQRGSGPAAPGGAIVVFDRVTGVIKRTIKGPNTGLADPHGIFVDTVRDEIVVVNQGHRLDLPLQPPAILVFPRTATGDVTPLRTIQGDKTKLFSPTALHIDTVHDQIAVANGNNTITIFGAGTKGNVSPERTLAGPDTGLSKPSGLFIDSMNNELVVSNWGNHTITVYKRTAKGNESPLRTILSNPGGPAVGFGNPGALALDLVNDEFAVTNCVSHPRVAFYDRLANGQLAPKRVIEGQDTSISRSLHGVSIDTVNDEVVIPSTVMNAILVFNRTDSGNAPPKRIIQGSLTNINEPQGVHVDTVHNEIAVANDTGQSVNIYDRLASGNVAPLRVITSTLFVKPVGIWIDTVNDEIVVGDGGGGGQPARILSFPRTANGLTVPLRSIEGSLTGLVRTRQIVVDTVNNEIIVASQGDRDRNPPRLGQLAVFNRLDNGNVAPKRFIRHVTNSNVRHPRSVFVDTVHDEIGVGDSKENEVRVFPRLF